MVGIKARYFPIRNAPDIFPCLARIIRILVYDAEAFIRNCTESIFRVILIVIIDDLPFLVVVIRYKPTPRDDVGGYPRVARFEPVREMPHIYDRTAPVIEDVITGGVIRI